MTQSEQEYTGVRPPLKRASRPRPARLCSPDIHIPADQQRGGQVLMPIVIDWIACMRCSAPADEVGGLAGFHPAPLCSPDIHIRAIPIRPR